jgi:fructose-bisphosphate aldolase class I
MVIAGKDCPQQAGIQQVAAETIRCLLSTVPKEVPGIAFLSGGQSDEDATAHLNAMNSMGQDFPWRVTFSYGRALQHAAMQTWNGDAGNVAKAQTVAVHRARMNGLASNGEYAPELEKAA